MITLVADKRLRSGLKAQQAHSPGHALGYVLVAPSGHALNTCFPSGRALNACAYCLIQLAELEKYLPRRRA